MRMSKMQFTRPPPKDEAAIAARELTTSLQNDPSINPSTLVTITPHHSDNIYVVPRAMLMLRAPWFRTALSTGGFKEESQRTLRFSSQHSIQTIEAFIFWLVHDELPEYCGYRTVYLYSLSVRLWAFTEEYRIPELGEDAIGLWDWCAEDSPPPVETVTEALESAPEGSRLHEVMEREVRKGLKHFRPGRYQGYSAREIFEADEKGLVDLLPMGMREAFRQHAEDELVAGRYFPRRN